MFDTAYYTSIFDNDRFITFTDAYNIELVFTKIEEQYRYDIIIDEGKIVAIKGIGGFFMACDATNAKVVERLRKKKTQINKSNIFIKRK